MSETTSSTTQKTGSSFGTGVATAGRVIADIRAVVATVVAIAMIVAAIFLLKSSKKNTYESASLTITSSNCPTATPAPGSTCQVSGTFTVGSQTIQVKNVTLTQGTAQVGSAVSILYNTQNPQQVKTVGLSASSEKKIAYILIGIAAAIIVLSWLWAYAAHKSRLVAQGTAGLEAASLVGRLF